MVLGSGSLASADGRNSVLFMPFICMGGSELGSFVSFVVSFLPVLGGEKGGRKEGGKFVLPAC